MNLSRRLLYASDIWEVARPRTALTAGHLLIRLSNPAIAFDLRLHETIAHASGNSRLMKEIQKYRLLVRSFCVLTGQQVTLQQALDDHIEILDALATQQPAKARKAMATHIASRLKDVLRRVNENNTEN